MREQFSAEAARCEAEAGGSRIDALRSPHRRKSLPGWLSPGGGLESGVLSGVLWRRPTAIATGSRPRTQLELSEG